MERTKRFCEVCGKELSGNQRLFCSKTHANLARIRVGEGGRLPRGLEDNPDFTEIMRREALKADPDTGESYLLGVVKATLSAAKHDDKARTQVFNAFVLKNAEILQLQKDYEWILDSLTLEQASLLAYIVHLTHGGQDEDIAPIDAKVWGQIDALLEETGLWAKIKKIEQEALPLLPGVTPVKISAVLPPVVLFEKLVLEDTYEPPFPPSPVITPPVPHAKYVPIPPPTPVSPVPLSDLELAGILKDKGWILGYVEKRDTMRMDAARGQMGSVESYEGVIIALNGHEMSYEQRQELYALGASREQISSLAHKYRLSGLNG
jgi:hypothetical protein